MYEAFWQRVNAILKEKHITQKALSLQCGFTERRIESIATYARSPSIDEVVKIALALNTTVEFLVTGQETANSQTKTELDNLKNTIKKFASTL